MADDNLKEALSQMTEALKQMTKVDKEALSQMTEIFKQMTKELIDAGDRQTKTAERQAKELIEAGERQAKELIEAGERQAKELIEAGERQAEAAERQTEAAERQTEAADRQAKINKKVLDRLEGHEANRLGRIAESVVANMSQWFIDKYFAIDIKDVFREVKIGFRDSDKKSDLDVLAIGDQVIIVIEVKTNVVESNITEFTNKVVRNFSNVKFIDKRDIHIPNLKKKKLCGGIAFVGVAKSTTEDKIIDTAEKNGLFVMKIMGKKSVELCNTKDNYKPKRHKI